MFLWFLVLGSSETFFLCELFFLLQFQINQTFIKKWVKIVIEGIFMLSKHNFIAPKTHMRHLNPNTWIWFWKFERWSRKILTNIKHWRMNEMTLRLHTSNWSWKREADHMYEPFFSKTMKKKCCCCCNLKILKKNES